jgi:dihydropteroate synthase
MSGTCKVASDDVDGGLSFESKAFHLCMVVEDVSCSVADIIRQEMLRVGGNAVISNYSSTNTLAANTDVLVMGNFGQIDSMRVNILSKPEVPADIGSKIQFATQAIEQNGSSFFRCGKYRLELGKKTYIMGILNVTPDSFSGDGLLLAAAEEQNNITLKNTLSNSSSSSSQCDVDKDLLIDAACRKAERMVADGADIIDVGGESTRPGYTAVDDHEESDRVIGVVEKLVKTLNVPISVDTSKSYVAENVLKAGAHIINDVNGLLKDPKIGKLAASYGAGVIVMHNPDEPIQGDTMSCIVASLRKSVDVALKSGLSPDNVVLDPGIGFGKTLEQNLEVMRRLDELKCIGYPVLLGTSKKSMIGKVLNLPVNERFEGTAATVTLGIAKGIDFVRVHDVKEICKVVKMSDAMIRKK